MAYHTYIIQDHNIVRLQNTNVYTKLHIRYIADKKQNKQHKIKWSSKPSRHLAFSFVLHRATWNIKHGERYNYLSGVIIYIISLLIQGIIILYFILEFLFSILHILQSCKYEIQDPTISYSVWILWLGFIQANVYSWYNKKTWDIFPLP